MKYSRFGLECRSVLLGQCAHDIDIALFPDLHHFPVLDCFQYTNVVGAGRPKILSHAMISGRQSVDTRGGKCPMKNLEMLHVK